MFKFKSKKLGIAASALVIAGVLAGCGASGNQLTVSSFGSQIQWRRKDIFNPFHKKTGIKVNPDLSNSPARFTKLEKNHGQGTDISELSQMNSVEGTHDGTFKKVNLHKLSNYRDLTPAAKKVAQQTDGVPFAVSSLGIVYNKKKLGKITSWKQLWTDKKLKGKVAIPPMSQTGGPAILAVAGELSGTPIQKDNGKAAFKELKKLKPNLAHNLNSNSDHAQQFKNGDVLASVTSEFNVPNLLNNNKDLAYVVPKGSFTNYDIASIAKHSKNTKQDYKYLNYRISKSLQTRDANEDTLNDSPVNKDVTLHGKSAKNKTYGKNAKHAKSLNYNFVKKHLSEWMKEWNAIMSD